MGDAITPAVIRLLLILALVAGGGCAVGVVGAAEPANGRFENDADGDGVPDGFKAYFSNDDTCSTLDAEVFRGGTKSLRIDAPTPADAGVATTVQLDGNFVYRLSGWVKAKQLKPKGSAQLVATLAVLDPAVNQIIACGNNHQGSCDWTQQQIQFVPPPDGRTRLTCFLAGWGRASGTAWFDELELVKLERVDAGVPQRELDRTLKLPHVPPKPLPAGGSSPLEVVRAAIGDDTLLATAMERLARKAPAYLLNAYDVGKPNDYFTGDYVWFSLKKERGYRFSERGKLGLINADTDLNYLLGFAEREDAPPQFFVPGTTRIHLINLLVEQLRPYAWLAGEVAFIPYDSATLLVVLDLRNLSDRDRQCWLYQAVRRSKGEPKSYHMMTVHTRQCVWEGYDQANDLLEFCYREGGTDSLVGALGATLCSAGQLFCLRPEGGPGPEDGCGIHGLKYALQFKPCQRRKVALAVHLRSFCPRGPGTQARRDGQGQPVVWRAGTYAEAKSEGLAASREAMASDWQDYIRQSIAKYRRFPLPHLPEEHWERGFYSAMEVPRGLTFNPHPEHAPWVKHPFYTHCRVSGQSHKAYPWWRLLLCSADSSTGTFGAVLGSDPGWQMHVARNLYANATPDGMLCAIIYKPAHGHCQPLIVWESWNTYLWTGDKQFLEETYTAGKRDHQGWLATRDRTGEGLCYFLDPWESLRDAGKLPGLREVPLDQQENIDVNCFLHRQERLLAEIAEELGRPDEAEQFRAMADKRVQLMNGHMWDAEHGCYYSVSELTGKKIRIMDIGTFLPLFAGIAPTERAASLVRLLRDPTAFGTQYPVATLDPRHPAYVPQAANCFWDGPNWPHYSWFVIKGLKDYGFYDQAARLAYQNAKMMFDGLEETSHLREFYNTETGEGCARYEYGWCGLPAAMVTQIHLGIEPTRQGICILPALPPGWDRAGVERQHIREAVLSLDVRVSPGLEETVATVNGRSQQIVRRRGIFLPWSAARGKLDVRITQPQFVPDTPRPPGPLPDLTVVPERKWAGDIRPTSETNRRSAPLSADERR